MPKNHRADTASILVAESETVARNSLSELLRDEGHQVFEAADSNSALDCINNISALDVILTDLEMPAWRSLIRHTRIAAPKIFILGMVGDGALNYAEEAQQLGAHGYLLKPLVFEEVNEKIIRLLTERKPGNL